MLKSNMMLKDISSYLKHFKNQPDLEGRKKPSSSSAATKLNISFCTCIIVYLRTSLWSACPPGATSGWWVPWASPCPFTSWSSTSTLCPWVWPSRHQFLTHQLYTDTHPACKDHGSYSLNIWCVKFQQAAALIHRWSSSSPTWIWSSGWWCWNFPSQSFFLMSFSSLLLVHTWKVSWNCFFPSAQTHFSQNY